MRRFAPALGRRLSRRNIALSPHLWSATGVMFAVYAVANVVIAFVAPQFDRGNLLLLGAALGVVAFAMLITRPPEPGSVAVHAVLMAAYLGSAGAVIAYQPAGSATVIAGFFTGPLLAMWLRDRRAVSLHLAAASVALVGAVAVSGGDGGTQFAVACFLPATWVLTLCCVLVLDAVEAQSAEHERLAMRDPLTGIGNDAYLSDALEVDLTRHRSTGAPLALVHLQIRNMDALNASIGRAAGDRVLATIARVISDAAPSTASIARTAGDRFTALLPATSTEGARQYADDLILRLALVETGDTALEVATAAATFPDDGTRRSDVVSRADQRLRAARSTQVTPAPSAPRVGGLAVQVGDLPPIEQVAPAGTPSADPQTSGWRASRVTRRGISRDPVVWRLTAGVLLLFAGLGAGALAFEPAVRAPDTAAVIAVTALLGVIFLTVRPPAIGTRANHAVITTGWLLPMAAMLALAPQASWAIGTAIFGATLIGTRLTDRWQMLAHIAVAGSLLTALMVSGAIDAPSIVAILTLQLSSVVLVVAYTTVFEAAETQGRQMADLVLRDPLTGAGNHRLLRERLADELPRHDDMQMPLVLGRVSLTGLDDVRHREGRGAVDEILRDVAVLLASRLGEHATVARTETETFSVLVPCAAAEDLTDTIRDLRLAIAGTSRRRSTVLARIGLATYPHDGPSEAELSALARIRAEADDPLAHLLVSTPAEEPLPVRRTVTWPRAAAEQPPPSRRSAG